LKDARNSQIAAVGAINGVNLGGDNRAVYVKQQRVSARYFKVLGIPLALGREFDDAEDRDGAPPVVILSQGIWRRLFRGDPSIVGHTIRLRGELYLVTGITGASFRQRGLVDVWTPLKPSSKGEGGGLNYSLVARLKPGATWVQAQAEVQMRGVAAFERRKIPADISARMDLAPFERANQASLRERLLILGAAVGVVLLIGCVNIALLMLARGSGRRREMGTRIALGGGPGSLIRQLSTESFVLGLVGGAAGLALGFAAIEALQTVVARYGVWQELKLDARVLLAMTFLSLTVSFLFGLAPALQAARVDVRDTLLESGSRSVVGGRSHWSQRALVLAEVALSLVLLVGAGLLIRTLLYLHNLDPGFNPRDVLTASASLQDARYSDTGTVNRLYRYSLEGIRKIPGVEAAAVGLHVPYQRWLNSGARIQGGLASMASEVGTSMNYVTPGYFDVLRIRVRAGRVIDERDTEISMPVAVVNETFARTFLKTQDALTGYIVSGKVTRQIVGVVSDLQQQPGLSRSGPITQEPAMYIPAAQFSSENFRMAHTWYSPNWVVRAKGRREEIARGIENAISAVDPLLPVASFRSMIDERDLALGSQRINAWLLGALAGLALLLALVGVYGTVANSVAERTREFGIRIALGGSIGRVIWSAVGPGVVLAVAGVIVGGVLAAGAVRLIKGLLYGVQPVDLPTFFIVAAILIGVSGLASLIPALGIARIAPADVLRQD
jgi:predicted permease